MKTVGVALEVVKGRREGKGGGVKGEEGGAGQGGFGGVLPRQI